MSYPVSDRYPLDPATCVHDKALAREGRCGTRGISLEDSEDWYARTFSDFQIALIDRICKKSEETA